MSGLFSELLTMATQEEQPQRLLFLFASVEESNPKKSKKHKKGTITPVMCVDKLPAELSDFDALVKEADSLSKTWDFVLISGLNGQNGVAPTEEDAEPFLNKMTNDVAGGQDLSRYMILDRKQQPIEMMGV